MSKHMNRCRNRWAVAMVICLVAGAALADNLMSIQIKNGHLRATPSFLGKIVAELNYAEQVTVLEKKDAWLKVRTSVKNAEGWLHSSAHHAATQSAARCHLPAAAGIRHRFLVNNKCKGLPDLWNSLKLLGMHNQKLSNESHSLHLFCVR